MKCSKTKLILSEYIDETLDANTRSLVEKHLLECEKCKADYASLKNLINELGELPRVKAPDDFLKNLHLRMESRFDMKKIVRTLFVPFKIKIPLELLTATAAAVLIIFFINIQQQEKPLTDLLYSQKTERLDDKSTPADKFGATAIRQPAEDKSILKRKSIGVSQTEKPEPEKAPPKMIVAKEAKEKISEPAQLAPAPQETMAAYRSKAKVPEAEKTIELTLTLDTSESTKPYSAIAKVDTHDQALRGRESEPDLNVGESDAIDLKSGHEEEKAGASESEEGMLFEDKLEKAPIPSIGDRVRFIVQANAGNVISVNLDEKTQQPVSILADIPSSKFKTFTSQLSQISRLEQPLPVIDETTNELLRVTIKLISSP